MRSPGSTAITRGCPRRFRRYSMRRRAPGSNPQRNCCDHRDAVTLRDPGAQTSHSNSPRRAGPPPKLLFLLIGMTAIGPLSLNILVPAVPGLVTALSTDTAAVQLT